MFGGVILITTRFEYKYLISIKDYIQIQPLIASFLIHDKQTEEMDYTITSIYFDDLYHTGAADKAFGNEEHKKFRIRYYDKEEFYKLELKHKVGDLSTKESLRMDRELKDALLQNNFDYLEKHMNESLIRKFVLKSRLNHLTDELVIKYKREAYHDHSDQVRITFDKEISVTDKEEFHYSKLIKDSSMILEVKYEHYLPKEIKTILNKIKMEQISYSKYVMGYYQKQY